MKSKKLKVLGIETSCDETSAAVVEHGRNLISCVVSTQIEKHKLYGGVVPEIASREHIKIIENVVKMALEKANLNLSEIDIVAVTKTPGLVGSLLVGVNFAKGLSFSLKKPLVGVNHLKAHIAANYFCHKNLKPPFLGLIISGGHTNIVLVENYTKFKLIGKTFDDSVGEAYDKIGRALGLSYPAGAIIDKLSQKGDEKKFRFPKPKIKNSKFNFSFSGLKTAALNIINNEKMKNNQINIEDFCASFQKTVCEIICEKTLLAAVENEQRKLVVCGGVCANSKIRCELQRKCKILNIELFMPDLEFCTDNAAMVASQGFFEFKNKNFEKDMSLNAIASFEF